MLRVDAVCYVVVVSTNTQPLQLLITSPVHCSHSHLAGTCRSSYYCLQMSNSRLVHSQCNDKSHLRVFRVMPNGFYHALHVLRYGKRQTLRQIHPPVCPSVCPSQCDMYLNECTIVKLFPSSRRGMTWLFLSATTAVTIYQGELPQRRR